MGRSLGETERALAWRRRSRVGLAALALLAWLQCAAEETSGFDGRRAFADLRDQVAIGPRAAGSAGAEQTRVLIADRLRQAGWPVEEHRFSAGPPGRVPTPMVNLIARQPGESADRILLAAHYDTKDLPGIRFVGANDGASGVAVLLELARHWGRRRGPVTLELVFFDGEEAQGSNITSTDGLFGSRALAEKMSREGTLEGVRALILIDMIGDRDLNIAVDRNSSPELRAIFAQVSGGLVDPTHELRLVDDHLPFRERGLERVLALIDFQYGSRTSPGPRWHTADDDLDGVAAESLNRVGSALVQLVSRLEREGSAAK